MLLIRCDATTDIGAGHFFRDLALAEAAIDHDIPVIMAMHRPAQTFIDIAAASQINVQSIDATPNSPEDAHQLNQLAKDLPAKALVVDGYHFDTAYYQRLIREDFTLAAIDDIAHQHFPVDILVNVNPHADTLNYDVPSDARLLLGVKYTLLRRQFRQARAALDAKGGPVVPEQVSKIIITLGGGDPTNETAKVLQALNLANYKGQADVIIGPANPHRHTLEELATSSKADIRFHQNVQNMAELMLGQHLAICAAGGTSWELACLGVPMMQMVIAENQHPIADYLSQNSLALFSGWNHNTTSDLIAQQLTSLSLSKQRRFEMTQQAKALVDGTGSTQIIKSMMELSSQ